jgi:hypothetical protein
LIPALFSLPLIDHGSCWQVPQNQLPLDPLPCRYSSKQKVLCKFFCFCHVQISY